MTFAVALALLAPAAADAASKPGVRTGGVSNLTFSSATLNGRVDPNDAQTTYFFRFGTTRVFTTDTAITAIGAGDAFSRVSVDVGGLAPLTQYHFRLIAQNSHGTTLGDWHTFTTRRQPLGVNLSASPNPVAPGGSTVLAGQLTGTNNAGREVVLQSNPFPYTQGFLNSGNALVTDSTGNFSFPVLSVPVNTQFRVVLAQRPEVASPIVIVGAALQVRTETKKVARYRHSATVRFRGSVTPQNDGGRVSIQKLVGGNWVEKAHATASDDGSSRSVYRKHVRISRSGQFRVVAEAVGQYVSGAGRTIRIKVPR